MKKGIIACVLCLFMAGCVPVYPIIDSGQSAVQGEQITSSSAPEDTPPAETSKDTSATTQEPGFATVGGGEFGFFIDIPDIWSTQAGEDGALVLEGDNPLIRMKVVQEKSAEEKQKTSAEPFLFANNVEGTCYDNIPVEAVYSFVRDGRKYSFIVQYAGDPVWYSDNKEVIDAIARSMRVQ